MVRLQAQDAPAVEETLRDAVAGPAHPESLAIQVIAQRGPVVAVMAQRVTVGVAMAYNNYPYCQNEK
jgi:hypothetical protein